tara:strand:- start:840 stop:1094 length:255 start_codon:yes stop_codon:yes gene_type:complete
MRNYETKQDYRCWICKDGDGGKMRNPYEPPKEEPHQKDSDSWGERYRPPTTDWCDFAFVMFIIALMYLAPYLIEVLAKIFKKVV